MLARSTLVHLRIPFSFFLLPVYLFALAVSPNLNGSRMLWTFLVLHFLLYPASNAFNSYFDKDEKSIGLIKHPPPVKHELYWVALLMDGAAIVIGWVKINALFALMLLLYGLASKAYSHPLIRLKRYPYTSWFIAGLFQGFFTFLMSYAGINDYAVENLMHTRVLFPALLSSMVLWASYPITQVYQHEEDGNRGDRTLSIVLGIKGTFWFALIFFLAASAGFTAYFYRFQQAYFALVFFAALAPMVIYFLSWFFQVWKDETRADYGRTMWMNFTSSVCLTLFFVWMFLETSHITQL
jgi:1,4-dihydroxy-2-naphthoate octaprenyltransferase